MFACAVCVLTGGVLPASASAALTIDSLALSRSTTEAGADPDLSASFSLGDDGEPEAAETATLGLPEGFFFRPDAVPRCTAATFATFECGPNTQVGLVAVRAAYEGGPNHLLGTAPLFALVPGPGETVAFGFVAPLLETPLTIGGRVRTESDFGFDLTVRDLPQSAPLASATIELWGVPADGKHDTERFHPGSASTPAGCPGEEGTGCIGSPPVASGLVPASFLRNPTACPGDDLVLLDVTTHEHPADHVIEDASAAATTGCDRNRFDTYTQVALTTGAASASTGLDVDIEQPRTMNPYAISQVATQSVELLLPPGFDLRPEALGSLGTCSEAQFAPDDPAPSSCPPAAKIGTVSLEIEGFEQPLPGDAYLGEPEPDGSLPLFLTASGAGLNAKLFGLLGAEPDAGETFLLVELPQAPIWHLDLDFGNEEDLFTTPAKCGKYEFVAITASWARPLYPRDTSDWATLDSHCSVPEANPEAPLTGPEPGPTDSGPAAPATRPLNRSRLRVRITHRPRHRTRDRTPTFRFAANRGGARFVCGVDRRKYRPCASPFTPPKLRFGRHVFRVRAIDAHGRRSKPTRWRFRILKRRRR